MNSSLIICLIAHSLESNQVFIVDPRDVSPSGEHASTPSGVWTTVNNQVINELVSVIIYHYWSH